MTRAGSLCSGVGGAVSDSSLAAFGAEVSR